MRRKMWSKSGRIGSVGRMSRRGVGRHALVVLLDGGIEHHGKTRVGHALRTSGMFLLASSLVVDGSAQRDRSATLFGTLRKLPQETFSVTTISRVSHSRGMLSTSEHHWRTLCN